VQPERQPSLARREREKKVEPTAELFALPRIEAPPVTKAVEPVVVKPRPRITFLRVVRDDADELLGLEPIYEDEE
jgi:hypothetical protein